MKKNINKSEIIKNILDDGFKNLEENEELIHLLLDKTIAQNINRSHKGNLKFGDKIADKMAEFAGSWVFIISFMTVLFSWILINILLLKKAFDPYPFILLNLILSCIAAMQAPVIMMSQNRQEQKDRLRAENDYKVNLKSEIIVEDLHVKIDNILENQNIIMEKINSLEQFKDSKN
jgi:uncharacterized membrane protein